MADNTLPPEGLSGASTPETASVKRRAFLRGAVAVGLPVVLATVHGRSVLAQTTEPITASGCASLDPSGWRVRNFGSVEAVDAACAALPDPLLEGASVEELPITPPPP